MSKYYFLILAVCLGFTFLAFSCERVPEGSEGVLVTNCGQNGMKDYQIVHGKQNVMGACTYLRTVPMFEKSFDMQGFKVTTKDGGLYTVDPTFTFNAQRGKSREIVFKYNNFIDSEDFLEAVAANKLSSLIKNVYIEEARNYSTDSLMRNVAIYESTIEARLKEAFTNSYFELVSIVSSVTPPEAIAKALIAKNQLSIQADSIQNSINNAKLQMEKDLMIARNQLELAKIQTAINNEKERGLSDQLIRYELMQGWVKAGCPVPQAVGSFPMYNQLFSNQSPK